MVISRNNLQVLQSNICRQIWNASADRIARHLTNTCKQTTKNYISNLNQAQYLHVFQRHKCAQITKNPIGIHIKLTIKHTCTRIKSKQATMDIVDAVWCLQIG